MKLYDGGVYLVNGCDIVEEGKMEQPVSREDAAKNTMAYGILESHNTSGNMQKLQIKFDKLTSHDITFVGIIQTARASGLEKFPIPYVLTNCHNSLCAVGGTINIITKDPINNSLMKMIICSDLPVQRNMAEYMYLLIRQLSISSHVRCLQAAAR